MNRSARLVGLGTAFSCLGVALMARVSGVVSLLVGAVCLGVGLPLVAKGMCDHQ